jgi:peptide/nickel transport system substrate-binding protein
MVLPLAYIADADGNPVPWNESRWVDEEFSAILKEAQGTLDIEARRALSADLQRIQLERGSVAIPFFRNAWRAYNPAFQGLTAHPTDYRLYHEVWFDPNMAS